jgi:hypothetical protein
MLTAIFLTLARTFARRWERVVAAFWLAPGIASLALPPCCKLSIIEVWLSIVEACNA